MKYQILTYCMNGRNIRRFFVERTERDLYKMIEMEISTIIFRKISDGTWRELSLHDLYMYVENRWYSLDTSKFKDFVYMYRLLDHMKDYCDIRYAQASRRPPAGYPERMRKRSEPLLIDRLDKEKK